MPPRRNCVFNQNLQQEFPLLKKTKDNSKVYCGTCLCEFSIANAGRSDITRHLETEKHINNRKSVASSRKLTSMLKNKNMGRPEELLAAKEGLIAYHTVNHYHSFNSVTCTSKIIRNLYDNKFTCAKTKCEAIITKVLAPYSIKIVVDELTDAKFVSLYLDASNHKNIKMIPILVRYFLPYEGVKVKLLEFESKGGETSDILLLYIKSVMSKYNLSHKINGMCADNTNTNYGGSKRQGKNNLYFKLKAELKRNIKGVGCSAHIIHNSIKNASDLLPIDFETIIVKIYSRFYIYTVRVETLKELCDDCETEYFNLIGYCKTRFLELFKSLSRIIELFCPLKEYFLSLDKCPTVLKEFFDNQSAELWLLFLHQNAGIFNAAVLEVEGEKTTIFTVSQVLRKLKLQLESRKSDKFLPNNVKVKMDTLVKKKQIKKNDFLVVVEKFYATCLEYLQEWAEPFLEFEEYTWMELQSPLPSWERMENSMLHLIQNLKEYNIIIDDSKLYEEIVLFRDYLTEGKIAEWEKTGLKFDERWVETFLFFSKSKEPLVNLQLVVEYIFSLPGSNAPTERIFSKANKTWTKDKSSLEIQTLKALLITKCNFEKDCFEFYEFLLTQPTLLSQIHSSEKYEKWI